MNDGSVVRCSHSAGQFSFSLLDELSVGLRRPRLREAPAGFGLEHLATTCMKNPGSRAVALLGCVVRPVLPVPFRAFV